MLPGRSPPPTRTPGRTTVDHYMPTAPDWLGHGDPAVVYRFGALFAVVDTLHTPQEQVANP